MALPDKLNWVNQAVYEMAKVLETATVFMAPSALSGGVGNVVAVYQHELDRKKIDRNAVVYCAVNFERDFTSDGDSASETDYIAVIKVHIEGKISLGATVDDKIKLWKAVQRAYATIKYLVNKESGPNGSKFDGFANLARNQPGIASEDEDDNCFYAVIDTSVHIDLTLQDYGE